MNTGPARIVALVALVLAACGGATTAETTTTSSGSGDPTTTIAPTTTTTAATTTTTTVPATTTTDALGLDDIPPECLAPLIEVLQIYEPAVSDVDWEHATIDDHIQVMFDLAGSSIDEPEECEVQFDVSDEEGAALLFELAAQEAPGTIGYLTAMQEIAAALDGREASGDCLTDIAQFEAMVAAGVPWVDLPLHEQWFVLSLMNTLGYCSLQTQGELFYRDEVQEFLQGSPFVGD